jgi:diguanylate cyclase (GGDEF)-like protein
MEAQPAEDNHEVSLANESGGAHSVSARSTDGCPWHLVQALLGATGEGLVVMDTDGTLVLANDRALHLLGGNLPKLPCPAPVALAGVPSRWLSSGIQTREAEVPSGSDEQSSPLLDAVQGLLPGDEAEVVLGSADHGGVDHVVRLRREPWLGPTSEQLGWILCMEDLSDRRRAEAAIVELALLDPLTALPNRSLLLDRLEQALLRLRRSQKLVAVAFLDVDDFKSVNDALGHAAGDELLVQIARRLEDHLRPDDTLGRLGGDELLVICESLQRHEDAEHLALRLEQAFSEPFSLSCGVALAVHASIGVAVGSAGSDPHELVAVADGAMYAAKQQGAPVVTEKPGALEGVGRLSSTERALRRALEDPGELQVRYQPVVASTTGAVVAFEADIALSADEAILAHRQLLPIAHALGELPTYTASVLDRIGADHASWTERLGKARAGSITIGLSLSPTQAQCSTFPDIVAHSLARTGLEPSLLVFGMTEGTVGRLSNALRSPMIQLAGNGVRLALDEFGSGLSSLALLRRLPFAFVKLEISGVSDHDELEEERQRRLLEALTISSRLLGSTVVGRGIARPHELEIVRSLGCSMAQGPLFGPPVDREGALAYLSAPRLPGWGAWSHQLTTRHPSA